MAGFIYYVQTDKQKLTRDDIKDMGLEYAFPADMEYSYRRVLSDGPEDTAGMTFCVKPQIPSYKPKEQTWQNCGSYWIGYENDSKPEPADLLRNNGLKGHATQLSYGKWVVPVARHFFPGDGSPIPTMFTVENGEISKKPDVKYRSFCDKADNTWYWFCKSTDLDEYLGGIEAPAEQPTENERLMFVAEAIGINYRVSVYELLALQAITTADLLKVEESILDWPTVLAIIESVSKKNDASTQDGSAFNDTEEAS